VSFHTEAPPALQALYHITASKTTEIRIRKRFAQLFPWGKTETFSGTFPTG